MCARFCRSPTTSCDRHRAPRRRFVRHDGDDPYFVVARRQGHGTFSDTAMRCRRPPASGSTMPLPPVVRPDTTTEDGDHGPRCWEAVKRHFREMGTDIQTTPFTVAGVSGTCSGDVFGNGMLLSPASSGWPPLRPRDIFIDPDPDPATGLAERQRLSPWPARAGRITTRRFLSPAA